MAKKLILLITDEPRVETGVRDILGNQYDLRTAPNSEAAVKCIQQDPPHCLIIDYELKSKDGLQVFRELMPRMPALMVSDSNSIPLAVTAAKLGIAEFLRKPIEGELLLKAIEANTRKTEERYSYPEGVEWLHGESPQLKEIFSAVREAMRKNEDILIFGEGGAVQRGMAEFIHLNSGRRERRFVEIDLASFQKEAIEAHFWATVQKLLGMRDESSLQSEKDLCGTLYLKNIEIVDDAFKATIFNFFAEKKRELLLIVGVADKEKILNLKAGNYVWIEIPLPAERKEDLPYLIDVYLRKYERRYNKNIQSLSLEALEFLTAYEYPGGYLELKRLIEGAVLCSNTAVLNLKDFSLNFGNVQNAWMKKGLRENLTLEKARRQFEKRLYAFLMEKLGGDVGALARFLDTPKTVLTERMENLLD